MPFVKGGGIFTLPDAVVANVFMQLPAHHDGFPIALTEISGAEDKVAMPGCYQGANKATGHVFKANATHIRTKKNGKMAHFIPLWIPQLP